MTFQLLPILGVMIELYQQPLGLERFQAYLNLMLNKDRTDVDLPIVIYNPMGKEHVLRKLEALQTLDAEALIADEIEQMNQRLARGALAPMGAGNATIRVAVALADDFVRNGWASRFSTDYASKFELGSLIKRNFCTPLFWTSEDYDVALLRTRAKESMYRILYQISHPVFPTIRAHVLQEAFISDHVGPAPGEIRALSSAQADVYRQLKGATDYPSIFAFLYGDRTASEFGYAEIGACDLMGFKFAQQFSKM